MLDMSMAILIAVGAVGLLLIIFICMTVSNSIKLKRILNHCKNGNLEQSITYYYDKLEHTAENIRELAENFDRYDRDNKNTLQRIGIVNFDAFDDISGKMSFSAAILNMHNDGIVLTSIYGHETSNVYIRKIKNGQTETHLLDEEKAALEKAVFTAEEI